MKNKQVVVSKYKEHFVSYEMLKKEGESGSPSLRLVNRFLGDVVFCWILEVSNTEGIGQPGESG